MTAALAIAMELPILFESIYVKIMTTTASPKEEAVISVLKEIIYNENEFKSIFYRKCCLLKRK